MKEFLNIIKGKKDMKQGKYVIILTTYILRAYHKHDTPVECITKAISHLEFELEKIKRNN